MKKQRTRRYGVGRESSDEEFLEKLNEAIKTPSTRPVPYAKAIRMIVIS
jgi:hypothetical protein